MSSEKWEEKVNNLKSKINEEAEKLHKLQRVYAKFSTREDFERFANCRWEDFAHSLSKEELEIWAILMIERMSEKQREKRNRKRNKQSPK